ncbi:MAG TPA: hypothetical protein VMU30_08275 [Bacteroidota bacterium]|nr:hypothetical protein [Bacteroidota bacterium]
MINKYFHFLVLVLLFTITSCKKENTTQPVSGSLSKVILPLAAGNSWTYQGQYVDTSGNVGLIDTVTMTTYGPDTIGGFAYGYWIQNSILGFIKYDGLYAQSEFEPSISNRALSFPTFIGDTVIYNYWLVKTRMVDTMISVQAGTFACIEYDVYITSNPIIFAKMFWSPNIGLVKLLPFKGYPSAEYRLISFKLY